MRSGFVLFLTVAALLVGVAWRLVGIEHTEGGDLRKRAERQHTATWTLPAQRGDILDCKLRVLAGSLRRPSVFMDPSLIDRPHAVATLVAPTLGLDVEQLTRLILKKKGSRFVWVKRSISERELDDFNRVRRANRLRSFVVRYEPTRDYPYGRLAAQVIGFVGADLTGLAGAEQAFNNALTGHDGQRSTTVDVHRRRVGAGTDSYRPPVDGATVVLTIDAHIQQRVEYHLQQAFDEHQPRWAIAVVMDPRSGEVLAMATLPSFDPTQPIPPGADEQQEAEARDALRNRCISDSYEPGSIFKPFVAAPALDDGVVQLDETFSIDGPVRRFGSRRIHDTHAYDSLPLWGIISKSSNIGMGLVGMRCGNERLYEYVRRFGFGDLTGIDLPGEHPGLVQSFTRWTGYSTQSIPIGQEIAATPIQTITAFCVFCNDGVLFRPRIVRGLISADGRSIEDNSRPIAIRRVLSRAATREFRFRALAAVVQDGTAKRAQLDDYQVFGKTGTAQVAAPQGGGYIPNEHVGSFVCGAPLDQPRVAVLVTMFRPSGAKYYGGSVAAPAAAAIVKDVLEYMRVPPDRGHSPGNVDDSDAVGRNDGGKGSCRRRVL